MSSHFTSSRPFRIRWSWALSEVGLPIACSSHGMAGWLCFCSPLLMYLQVCCLHDCLPVHGGGGGGLDTKLYSVTIQNQPARELISTQKSSLRLLILHERSGLRCVSDCHSADFWFVLNVVRSVVWFAHDCCYLGVKVQLAIYVMVLPSSEMCVIFFRQGVD